MRKIFFILATVLCLILGFYIGNRLPNSFLPGKKSEVQSTILLEEIRDVMKLVSVEGYFSEIYDYKDFIHLNWKPFSKKALIRVRAKVSVGYDLSRMNIHQDHEKKTMTLSGIDEPEILSIDHDLDYYDIQEGAFNSFTADDYNQLNKGAKDYIESRVEESALPSRARTQLAQIIQSMQQLAGANGWTIIWQEQPSGLTE